MQSKSEPIAKNHLSENFWLAPHYFKQTLTRRQLKESLLYHGGWILACGEGWTIKSKHLGAGVYEVSLVRR